MPTETKTPAFARVAGSVSMRATTATAKSSVRNFELSVIGDSVLFVSVCGSFQISLATPECLGLLAETQAADECCSRKVWDEVKKGRKR